MRCCCMISTESPAAIDQGIYSFSGEGCDFAGVSSQCGYGGQVGLSAVAENILRTGFPQATNTGLEDCNKILKTGEGTWLRTSEAVMNHCQSTAISIWEVRTRLTLWHSLSKDGLSSLPVSSKQNALGTCVFAPQVPHCDTHSQKMNCPPCQCRASKVPCVFAPQVPHACCPRWGSRDDW